MRRVAWIAVYCVLVFFCAGIWWLGTPASATGDGGAVSPRGELGRGVSPLQLAGRYHLRTRTERFFDRSASRPPQVKAAPRQVRPERPAPIPPQPQPEQPQAAPTVGAEAAPAAPELAGRYHLRTRTRQFFARPLT